MFHIIKGFAKIKLYAFAIIPNATTWQLLQKNSIANCGTRYIDVFIGMFEINIDFKNQN